MSRTFRTFCLLALLNLPLATGSKAQDPAWRTAAPGWQYEFPRDHGPHREFKTEWWYATGNLTDEQGHEYGFQLTFFREGIQPGVKPEGSSRFRVTELPFAHFAVTDATGKNFHSVEQSSRGAFGEAGFSTPVNSTGRIAWMHDWLLEQVKQGGFHLKAATDDHGELRSVDLILTQDRPPLIHGHDGISPKSSIPGHASHYYSLTHLQASGTVEINGKSHAVKGLVWFDHEWATNSLEPNQSGWDWAGLHLSNGDDLMLFRIRDKQGNEVFHSGILRDPKGTSLPLDDLVMTPEGSWKSPHTGGLYPASWKLNVPSQKLRLSLSPKLADQELVLSPFAYWEGAVKGEGIKGGDPIRAEGYFEMTGYGGNILGLSK
jgi:predicted secreted hydrolase